MHSSAPVFRQFPPDSTRKVSLPAGDPLNEMMFCITDAFKEKWKDFKWKALVAAGLVSQPMDYSYHYIELGWTDKNFYVYIWADPYGGWWRTPPQIKSMRTGDSFTKVPG